MAASSSDAQQAINAADEGTQKVNLLMRQRLEQLARQDYEPYERERAAPLPPEIARARQMANQVGLSQPMISEAQRLSSRQRPFPQVYREYMNPYVKDVVEEMGRAGNENITNNIVPMLDAKFSRLGQFGSTAHQKALGRAIRDMQQDIRAEQKKALLTGYATAADIHGREQQNQTERANTLGRLSAFAQAGKESDIGALSQAGNYERQYQQYLRDIALQDYLRQHDYNWDAISKWISLSNNIPIPTTVTSMGVQPQQPTLNPAGSAGVIGANLLGSMMQQTPVANLTNPIDFANQAAARQRNYVSGLLGQQNLGGLFRR